MNLTMPIHLLVVAVTGVLAGAVGAQTSAATATVQVPRSVGTSTVQVEPTITDSVSYSSADSAMNKLRGTLALTGFAGPDASAGVFIVPAEEITSQQLAAIAEDVNVMTRIFQNRLAQANLMNPHNPFPLFVGAGSRHFFGGADRPRSLYLQGYGVLFMMEVDFPLAPGPETQTEEPAPTESDVDPVWAQAREEIYQPQARRKGAPDQARPTYSAERVELLKTTLIHSLVHAANIRHLAPDESIVITIAGSALDTDTMVNTVPVPGTSQIVVKGRHNELKIMEKSKLAAGAPVVLTIRAKAADIKALSQGQLTDDQFRQRVKVLSHPATLAPVSALPQDLLGTFETVTIAGN